jgi:NhaP-type Na+/H+ or K+/H+ antiporter
MMSLCTKQYIQQSSGVLVVFITTLTVSKLIKPETLVEIKVAFNGIWFFAEIILFTLIGTALSFDPSNGPLTGQRGLSADSIRKIMSVMFTATFARLGAIIVCVLAMAPRFPKHR